ncbi:hypothetical protein ACQ4PT_019983 [Festuca glaucescens]
MEAVVRSSSQVRRAKRRGTTAARIDVPPVGTEAAADEGSASHIRYNSGDWANIDDGLARLIAKRILTYDVADYVRFRDVCRPWHRCSSEPRTHGGMDRRFHPWRWTMLRDELAVLHRRCFLNTTTRECVKVDIPELHSYKLLAFTHEGLLVLACKPSCTTTICMLNPLTRHLIHLPPLSTLVHSEDHDNMLPERGGLSLQSYYRAWGSGIANDDSTVMLCFHLNMLGMAKPGDDHWTLLNYDGRWWHENCAHNV